ncbi:MAG TPA: hypothetical protein VFI31_26250 [Pirellulales bacterium]|nr:hypothetical protein [Pirellulales bacterium]
MKNNLAPDVATFGRAFDLVDGQIRWHRDDPAPSLAEALLPSTHNSDRRHLRHAAAAWLEEALAAGPLPSKELYRQGAENGFSQGTLKRAATELGIHPHKTGFDGGWEMRWTPPPEVRGRGTTATRAGAGFKIFGGDDEVVESEKEKVKSERDEVDENTAHSSCASSRECEEIDVASCASSTECEETGRRVARLQENNAKCKTQNDASGSSLAPEIAGHKAQDLKPTTSGGENPTDGGRNVYTAIGDALQEAYFKSAS